MITVFETHSINDLFGSDEDENDEDEEYEYVKVGKSNWAKSNLCPDAMKIHEYWSDEATSSVIFGVKKRLVDVI